MQDVNQIQPSPPKPRSRHLSRTSRMIVSVPRQRRRRRLVAPSSPQRWTSR